MHNLVAGSYTLIITFKRIFGFSNPLIGIFDHFPVVKFQNTLLVNKREKNIIFKAGFENLVTFLKNLQEKYFVIS